MTRRRLLTSITAAAAQMLLCLLLLDATAIAAPQPPQPPCVKLRPAAQVSNGRDVITTILPRSIDPRGCSIQTVHGTAVYKVLTQMATWTAPGPDGKIERFDMDLGSLVKSVETIGSRLVVYLQNGRHRSLPGNAAILPPSPEDFALYFVEPGQKVPSDALSVARGTTGASARKPDYVIP